MVKSCCPCPLSFPGRRAPRLSTRPVKAAWPRSAGHPSAAQPGQRGPLPVHGTAVRLLLQLPPSSGSSSSSSHCHREPDATAAPGLLQLQGRGDAGLRPQNPWPLLAAGSSWPAAPRCSSAPTARATSSGSRAASCAPAPAPPLRGVLSGVPAPRARASPAFPPAGPSSCTSLLALGLGVERSQPLRLQSFSSGGCSRNKRGGGAEAQRNSWEGVGPPETGDSGYFPSLSPVRTHPESRAVLSFSGGGF